MLIEFSVSNFRSFRERQTLSMVATPRLSKKENVIKAPLTGEKFPDLLKVAAIYGPNASGKSSLLQALKILPLLLSGTPTTNVKSLPVKSFRFDRALENQPSKFEYAFIVGGVRYELLVSLTESRIFEEKLVFYPRGRETLLYDRSFEGGGELYKFGELLEGGQEVHEAWRRLTGSKTLFLSQAVANSSEDLKQLKIPFDWFKFGMWVFEQDAMLKWSQASMNLLKQSKKLVVKLEEFLRDIDIPVSNIRFESTEEQLSGLEEVTSNYFDEDFGGKTTLTHTSALGEAEFDFSEESGGTRNLIGFWLPWTAMKFHSEDGSGILAVDELDSSLHPEIVARIIREHLNSNSNAQLIFTTHDTHLMSSKILRRDQFWITERDASGASNMFSIHDFEGREGEDVERRYFSGRYRGLPFLKGKQ